MTFDLDSVFRSSGYDVLEYIYMIDWDDNMGALHNHLSKYKSREFAPNERLVFINDDTEYIVGNLRFNTFNLQSLLRNLDIPNYFCMIVGQSNLRDSLEDLRKFLTNDTLPIQNAVFQGHLLHYPPPAVKTNINAHLVERSYIFLNNIMRSHRCFMISWLIKQGIINKGFVSFNRPEPLLNLASKEDPCSDDSFRWISPIPFSRVNENWICTDDSLLDVFSSIPPATKNFTEDSAIKLQDSNEPLLQRAFLYISSETVFNYPDPYLSEKSFKGFVAMRPMIVFGPRGALAHLRSLGFKTWSSYWDESYDDIDDPTDRFKAVGQLIKNISTMSLSDQINLLSDMEPMLLHNRDLYVDRFIHMQAESLKTQLLTMRKR